MMVKGGLAALVVLSLSHNIEALVYHLTWQHMALGHAAAMGVGEPLVKYIQQAESSIINSEWTKINLDC